MSEKFYTPEEIAGKFKVNVATVWEWIRKGKLGAVKVGRLYRVSEDQLNDFIKVNE